MKIGIRKEDKGHWEKRAPLAPRHVKTLVDSGMEVLAQRSDIRAFTDDEYLRAGASLADSVDDADIILGVKEIPMEKFSPEKTYMFFSHTIKGQAHNMPSLIKMMELQCSLIDYERITDDDGKRLVFFGPFAGKAGMIDALWGLGIKWRKKGHETPFAEIKQTVEYRDLTEIKSAFRKIGEKIKETGFPAELGPVVIGFAGYGNVSLGAQEILDFLPVTPIGPAQLHNEEFFKKYDNKTIYKVIFTLSDMYRYQDNQPFDKFDFFKHPERFSSDFEKYWRHLTMLVNAIYWSEKADRIVKRADIAKNPGRLEFIADISCDIEGGIEITAKATTIDKPFITFFPEKDEISDGLSEDGLPVLAVDNLPCELSKDATNYFGEALTPLLLKIPGDDSTNFDNWPEEIKHAIILKNGVLTENYRYLEKFL